MLEKLYGSVLLPAFEAFKGRKTFRYLKELQQSQWLGRAEVERIQFDRLPRLVEHAFAHCPYHRRLWQEHGLDPGRLQAPADWVRWPLTRREDVLAHRPEMRSDQPGSRVLSKSTGGSTGVPLHFDLTLESHERRTAATYRGYAWAGAGPGTKQVYLWGVALGERSRRRRLKDFLWERLINRRLVLNCFDLGEGRLVEFLDAYNRYRPDAIVAYANALYFFAQMLDERGLRPRPPRAAVVGAEKLYPHQRALIEKVFQAPVFETYGCREFMLLAAECDRHAGMHLTAENLLVEVVDDEGRPVPDGEEGDVAVTDLTNFAMPFVRYVNGDRAVAGWADCPCGRGLPLLRQVVGRRADTVTTPDGRRLSGVFFPHLMKDYPAVRRFQAVQDAPDHLELRLMVAPGWTDEQRRQLERTVRENLGPEMRLDLLVVDDIPLNPSGKLQVVVNRCGPAPAGPEVDALAPRR